MCFGLSSVSPQPTGPLLNNEGDRAPSPPIPRAARRHDERRRIGIYGFAVAIPHSDGAGPGALVIAPALDAAASNPRLQVAALGDIGPEEGGTAVEDTLDADGGDADAAADAEAAQVVQMQRDGRKAVVAHGRAAERHAQLLKLRQAECHHFRRRV